MTQTSNIMPTRLSISILLCAVFVGCSDKPAADGDAAGDSTSSTGADSTLEAFARSMVETWINDDAEAFVRLVTPEEADIKAYAEQRAEISKEPIDAEKLESELKEFREAMADGSIDARVKKTWEALKNAAAAAGVDWKSARFSRIDYDYRSRGGNEIVPEAKYTIYVMSGDREYSIKGDNVFVNSQWQMDSPPQFQGPVYGDGPSGVAGRGTGYGSASGSTALKRYSGSASYGGSSYGRPSGTRAGAYGTSSGYYPSGSSSGRYYGSAFGGSGAYYPRSSATAGTGS